MAFTKFKEIPKFITIPGGGKMELIKPEGRIEYNYEVLLLISSTCFPEMATEDGIRQVMEIISVSRMLLPLDPPFPVFENIQKQTETMVTRKFKFGADEVSISVNFNSPNTPIEIINQTFNDIVGNQEMFIQGSVVTPS